MTAMEVPLPERCATNEPALQRAEIALHLAGLETRPRTTYDTLSNCLVIHGRSSGYGHRLRLDELQDPDRVAKRIARRETALLRGGYPKFHRGWAYETDREDDRDRYIHIHYAVKATEGRRLRLDVSSNSPEVNRDFFRLLAMLGFPTRHDLPGAPNAPIRQEQLEALVFAKADAES